MAIKQKRYNNLGLLTTNRGGQSPTFQNKMFFFKTLATFYLECSKTSEHVHGTQVLNFRA